MEFLEALNQTPVPTLLVVAGVFLVALPIVVQVGKKIELSDRWHRISIRTGLVLFFIGGSLFWIAAVANIFFESNPPVIMGVVIRQGQEGGELVYYEEVNFFDDEGDATLVERELVDLSDPSQAQYIQVEDSPILEAPEIQKIRSTATRTWHCEGRVYNATVEVTLVDTDSNRSEPVHYSIECR